MTPERVKAIAEAAWIQPHYRPLDVAIERAITQAVNEALEEAAKLCCQISDEFWDKNKSGMSAGAEECEHGVRALKLPEE